MKTVSKVNEPKPWEGQHGTMYEALISFTDGTSGRVNMKSPDKWKEGDEVEIFECQPNIKYGDKLKIGFPKLDGAPVNPQISREFPAKENTGAAIASKPFTGGKWDSEIQYKIDASWAITSAIAVLGESCKLHIEDGSLKKWTLKMLEVRGEIITQLKANEQS